MNLLLVEDSPNDRILFTRLLAGEDVKISYASTLKAALAALEAETFTCVIVDPGLPDSIATETLKKIMDRNPNAVAFAYSGSTDPDVMDAAIKAGVHAWLHKGKDDQRAEDVMRVIKDAILRCKAKARG